jgi:phosphatidylserine/phosphatidylglycerophosphate/cardiolipin synthase-like enzyme
VALSGATEATRRATQRSSIDVVWTGPASSVTSSRLIAAVVIELIEEARREVLLVSYAAHTEPTIEAALAAASARGVGLTLLLERHADNPQYAATAEPFSSVNARRWHWPADQRSPGASLHAKIIVVDGSTALVGSANLTGRAMEDNLECGVLLRGDDAPRAIRDHLVDLKARGELSIL